MYLVILVFTTGKQHWNILNVYTCYILVYLQSTSPVAPPPTTSTLPDLNETVTAAPLKTLSNQQTPDIRVTNDVRLLQNMAAKLDAETKEIMYHIKKVNGKLLAHCTACRVDIAPLKKKLDHLKQHRKRTSHKFHCEVARLQSDSKPEGKERRQLMYQAVETVYPHMFTATPNHDFLVCREDKTRIKLDQTLLISNIDQHISKHKKHDATSLPTHNIASFFKPVASLPHCQLPASIEKCHGFHVDNHTFTANGKDMISVNPRLLMDDFKEGEDSSEVSWYPEPHYVGKFFVDGVSKSVKGTFRSSQCSRAGPKGTMLNSMCSSCRGVPKLQSFRKRLLIRIRTTS